MTHLLDARRLLCPMPVIRTQDRVETLKEGEELKVTATDPGVVHDIPAWCRIHGHRVVVIEEEGEEINITICVGDKS